MPNSPARGRADDAAPAARAPRRAVRAAGPPAGGDLADNSPAEATAAEASTTDASTPTPTRRTRTRVVRSRGGETAPTPADESTRRRAPERAPAVTFTAPTPLAAGEPTGPVEPGTDAPDATTPEPEPLPLLDHLAEPLRPVVTDERRLQETADALAAGTGPLALDAERASGYRYGQRAYLVQLRREGAGTWLIDPIACPDLAPIAEATAGVEWILHAATQDLPCLAEVGLRPSALFDTELAARLLGLPRAGLGAVVEHYLHVRLAKEHSAVDWSTRPLPEPWLLYAALDVELLADLREAMVADLRAQGKDEWARQEFEHLLDFTGPAVRVDPWRRTSGLHRVRGRRSLAVVRELWQTRDDLARERDIAPGRILPDAALLGVATAAPTTGAGLAAAAHHRSVRRHEAAWLAAIARAQALPESKLPPTTLPSDAPPPPRAWADRHPVAAARLAAIRTDLAAVSEERGVPVENLLTPDVLRRVVWSPGDRPVAEELAQRGARPWQIEIVAPVVEAAFRAHS